VAELEGDSVIGIEEMPGMLKSDYAVTGLCRYDDLMFYAISMPEPSGRGEFESVDVNGSCIDRVRMGYRGLWNDGRKQDR
jgi:glucose-1-phosphate thymidylyltransferase